MTALDDSLRALRAAALRTERASQIAILAAWKHTLQSLAPYITAAVAQAVATQASQPGASFAIASLPAVRALAAAFSRELPLFGMVAGVAVREGTTAAVSAAPDLAARVIVAALGTPPPGAVVPNISASALFVPNEQAAQIAGTIAGLAPGMGDAGAQAIAEGVRAGMNPRAIAREVRRVANMAPTRALVISRHAVNEGFRRSAIASYKASGVVVAYRRLSARNRRTCAACWALDGKEYDLDEPFYSHACCRCCAIPIVRDSTVALPVDGPTAFEGLSAEDQRFILGPGKFDLFQNGAITLADLASETFSPVYGRGVRETTLRELKGAA